MQPMDEIYQEYARTVYKYLLSKTCNEDLAEELTQETFYQAVRSIDRFDESCKISTWLCAIAKNQLFSYQAEASSAKSVQRSPFHSGNFEKTYTASDEITEVRLDDRIIWSQGESISVITSAVYNCRPVKNRMVGN